MEGAKQGPATILGSIRGVLPELESLYKEIHSHPEFSMQEIRTAALVMDKLRASGYEVTGRVGKTGVAAVMRNGVGPTVMLRADMDALPVQESTGLPYASSATATFFDAAGLGLFAVAGAEKAMAFHAAPIAATVFGMLIGIGGRVARDILVREIPTVLRTQLYAVAALAGAAFVVVGHELHLPSSVGAGIGSVVCIGLRLLALRYGWHFPVACITGKSA